MANTESESKETYITDDDLVEASRDVARGEPFELLASLEQEASVRHAYLEARAVPQPDEESGVTALSVDSQQVEVLYTSQSEANFISENAMQIRNR